MAASATASGGGRTAEYRIGSVRLAVDGRVGPKTWQALFDEKQPARPALTGSSLALRCLALTGAFARRLELLKKQRLPQ